MHQAPISHPNNLYSVERIHDDNVNANNFSITPSGLKYYTILITPNDYSQLVCSGNFTIDGLSSSWVYNSDYHPSAGGGVNSCYPVNPPWHGSGVGKSLAHSTPHSYILKGGAGSNTCWGPNSPSGQNFTGNGTYRFNGPFEFDNSVYCDGAFLSQFSNPVTWRKIILMDIYENDQGNLINDQYDPATYSEDLETWLQYMPDPSNPNFAPLQPTHNGYPKHIKAFVFPQYHPEVDLQETMEVDLDIDYVIPAQGCTDSSANNYDSLANTNDGSCSYAPVLRSILVQDIQFVHGTPSTVYTDPPFPSEVPETSFSFGTGTIDFSSEPFMPKNLFMSGHGVGGSLPLTNQYFAGDLVNETIQINLFPRTLDALDNNGNYINAIATFDFPFTGGPHASDNMNNLISNGTMAYLGDALNNLTAASISINNIDEDGGTSIGRGVYVANGQTAYNGTTVSAQPSWVPDSNFDDDEGNVPQTIVDWGNLGDQISFLQPDGTLLEAEYDSFYAEEKYRTTPILPGENYFPYKIEVFININFFMPDKDVYLTFDFIHDTKRLLDI